MKQFKNIILLAGFACAITVFWLAPGINKADSDHVRVYEDTYAKPVVLKQPDIVSDIEPTAIQKTEPKKYLTQKIKADVKLEDIEPEMFSRAIHFHEEVLLPEVIEVEIDSTLEVALDSIELAVLDTASVIR